MIDYHRHSWKYRILCNGLYGYIRFQCPAVNIIGFYVIHWFYMEIMENQSINDWLIIVNGLTLWKKYRTQWPIVPTNIKGVPLDFPEKNLPRKPTTWSTSGDQPINLPRNSTKPSAKKCYKNGSSLEELEWVPQTAPALCELSGLGSCEKSDGVTRKNSWDHRIWGWIKSYEIQ